MSHHPVKGLFAPISTRHDALLAVRGSGLPSFMIGFLGLIGALMIAGPGLWTQVATLGVLSVALMGVGYAIRQGIGHPTLVPLAWALLLALVISTGLWGAGALVLAQLLFSILAANGLRGWLWLRGRAT